MMNIHPFLPGMQRIGRTRKKILLDVEEFGLGSLSDLVENKINLDILRENPTGQWRRRIYDRTTTFLLFLLQVMGSLACGSMVKYLQAVRIAKGGNIVSSSTSAYCQARSKLELPTLKRIFDSSNSFLSRSVPSDGTWHGFKVTAVDGTKVDLPDTPANLEKYPKEWAAQPHCQKKIEKDCGGRLPKLNITVAFDLFTAAVIAYEHDSEQVGEQTLWRRLLDRVVKEKVITLGDALYCTFGNIIEVQQHHGEAAFEARNQRIFHGRGRYAKDFQVSLPKPRKKAVDWTNAQWDALPESIKVRVISTKICRNGFRPSILRIVTTLLDKSLYPAHEVLELHFRRWYAELRIRELKSAMGMETLVCKTPEMIEKELMMHMIALNLVRAMSTDAARLAEVEPASISFSAALAQTTEWMRLLAAGAFSTGLREQLPILFMKALADAVVKRRPGRSEPRAMKKRPKPFPMMKTARQNHPVHFIPNVA